MVWRRVAGLDGRRPERQTCRLELSLNSRTGKLLRDYADGNSRLILGPDSPATNPYNTSATPDVLDILITRDLPSSVHLTSCSALSSDQLPVLIYTMCRSSFQHPPDRSDVRRTDWAKFQTHLEAEIRSTRNCIIVRISTRMLRTSPAPSLGLWKLPLLSVAQLETHAPDPGRYSG